MQVGQGVQLSRRHNSKSDILIPLPGPAAALLKKERAGSDETPTLAGYPSEVQRGYILKPQKRWLRKVFFNISSGWLSG